MKFYPGFLWLCSSLHNQHWAQLGNPALCGRLYQGFLVVVFVDIVVVGDFVDVFAVVFLLIGK